jgi:NAD(P)H-hydrate epimerase
MLPVFTAEAMRALDRRAITELGIPGATLMEHAGRGAALALLAHVPGVTRSRRPVVIVCGKGGNGGDGFVVARELKRRRVPVQVFLAAPAGEIVGDARAPSRAASRARIRPVRVEDGAGGTRALTRAHGVVDGLRGTGARGAPAGVVADLIAAINASGRPVIALDIPSGLPADGDPISDMVVRADLTVTFAGLKRGLVMGPGVDLAGKIVIAPIGLSTSDVERGITTFLLERDDVKHLFPRRPRDSHKGDWGRLLLVAGSLGKTGAAVLAARAAMRSGSGLVTVATPVSQQPVVAALVLEPMTEPVAETAAQTVGLASLDRLRALADACDAIAIGPGLGLDADTADVVTALTRDLGKPLVLDADALTALVGRLDVLRSGAPRVLTPHPGEMARLLGVSTTDVQRDRITVAQDFAARHGVHLVLKGATSVIARPDGRVLLNPTGNAGMASGGTGDVLTGVVGAFLARGLDPGDALAAGVYLHGRAGDLAAARHGEESLIASDVIEALPEAFADLARPAGHERISVLVPRT